MNKDTLFWILAIIQGYIIYAVFIGVMVMLQVFLIPKISSLSLDVNSGLGSGVVTPNIPKSLDFGSIFIVINLVQGLFSGLLIGKFAEGDYKQGIKHVIVMVFAGYILSTTLVGIFQTSGALA